jgi:hypothetical protein
VIARESSSLSAILLIYLFTVLASPYLPITGHALENSEISEPTTPDYTADTLSGSSLDLPAEIEPPISLGQPSRHKFQWGLVTGYSWDEDHVVSRFFLNDHLLITVPQMGGVKITAEVGLQKGRYSVGGTGSVYAELFGIQNGLEYDTRRGKFLYRLGLDVVARRAGLAHRGDRLRLEWVPATRTVQFGVTINSPWIKYRRNRPLLNHVPLLPVTPRKRPAADSSLYPADDVDRIVFLMRSMDRLLTPRLIFDINSHRQIKKFDRNLAQLKEHLQTPDNAFPAMDSSYHALLRRAFAHTAGGNESLGHSLASTAERILLENLVIPVNQMFGQLKKPFNLSQFSEAALSAFWEYTDDLNGSLPDAGRSSAQAIFHTLVRTVETIADEDEDRWDSKRLVWLPLNFGLRPDAWDTQTELNEIISKVLDRDFDDANHITYLHNDRGYYEFERLVRETEYYHVFHIHDVSGQHNGAPDPISWRLVTDGYIESFVNAIEAVALFSGTLVRSGYHQVRRQAIGAEGSRSPPPPAYRDPQLQNIRGSVPEVPEGSL